MKLETIDGPYKEITQMVNGSTMLKAGRLGRPHFRKFQLSPDLKLLQWESPNKDKAETSISIKQIQELVKGQKTKVFEGNPIPEYEAISFSLLYKQGNLLRSLDIVCKDRTEYDFWTVGMEALIIGFDDVDGIGSFSKTMSSEDISSSKLSLEFGLIGQRISVKEDACDIYTWGASVKGTLGHGEQTEELIPRVIESLLGRDIRYVACGTDHTLALSAIGELFSWGSGRGGKLGFGNIQDRFTPLKVGILEEKQITAISCSELHSALVTAEGEAYTFGRTGPRLGYSVVGRKQAEPRKVELLSNYQITNVSCGWEYTIVLTSNGQLLSFGVNESGQLGHGDYKESYEPQLIDKLKDIKIREISCGSQHAGVVTVNGDVWIWGANDYGQLGTGDTETRNLPYELPSTFWNEEIQSVRCGGKHTMVLSCTGTLYCFGDGQFGQLGVNIRQDSPYLSIACNVPIPDKVIYFDCGLAHTAAVTEAGSLYTWGKGSGGRLGHADHASRFTPTLVESLAYKQVQSVTCGAHHTAACVIRAWVNDAETKNCMACKLSFTALRRRHHCRKCGGIFCAICTTKKFPILEMGYTDPVRVCERCYATLSESKS